MVIEWFPIFSDSMGTANMAKNPIHHKRSKYIDVRHHFVRGNVEKGHLCMGFCKTEERIVDILTKALSRNYFERTPLGI